MKLIFTFISICISFTSAVAQLQKTTTVKQRVIGSRAHLISPGVVAPADTARYVYSSYHGSFFNYNSGNYEAGLDGLNFNDYFYSKYPHIDFKPLVRADSSFVTIPHDFGPDDIYQYFITFSPAEEIDSLVEIFWPPKYWRFKLYNERIYPYANGKPQKKIIMTFPPEYIDFAYNSTMQAVADSTPPSSPFTLYNYDALGRLSEIITYNPDNELKSELEYDSNGMLSKLISSFTTTLATWHLSGKTETSYTTNGICKNSVSYEWNDMSGTWNSTGKTENHLNANGLPDTSIIFTRNSNIWEPMKMTTFTYNSYGNPVEKKEYQYTNGTFPSNIYKRTVYYYELYNDLGISDKELAIGLKVYPNPSSQNVTIELEQPWTGKGEISVYNGMGQMVQKEHMNSSRKTINISNLASGYYWLLVSTTKGQACEQIQKL